MPIKLPELDNRTYADLVNEAVASIPDLHPGWTDHNPSNPGIALIELFAWLTEMVLYRTNQIPQRNYEVFLKILNGKHPNGAMWELPAGQDIETAIRETMKTLRERYRAVSKEDYEYLVRFQWPASSEAAGLGASSRISRVCCLPEYNLTLAGDKSGARGYITLLVVPEPAPDQNDPNAPWLLPSEMLKEALEAFFRDRWVLTTILHVAGPDYLVVRIRATIYLRDDAQHDGVRQRATKALMDYFHPSVGGVDGRGWPFGRAVHASEMYTVLDKVQGIDFVDPIQIGTSDATREIREGEAVTALALLPWELAKVAEGDIELSLRERRGDEWVVIS